MNNKVKETIKEFSSYAREQLNGQQAALMDVKGDHLLSGKLQRMKVFNEHHELLKENLQEHIRLTLNNMKDLPQEQYNKLNSGLISVYAECINDYLSIPFVKDME